jgi:hypothetical protein
MKQDKIERFINLIRDTHSSIETIYCYGGCYQFFLILREMYPTAEAWYSWQEGHVYTKIGKYWYDIRGKYLKIDKDARKMGKDEFIRRPDRWKNCLNDRFELINRYKRVDIDE